MEAMKVADIIRTIDSWAPFHMAESWDNVGLQVGDQATQVTGVLTTLDVTIAVIDEAIACGANVIVAHHPLIFEPLGQVLDQSDVGKIVRYLIRNDVALIVAHTNVDQVPGGVSHHFLSRLGVTSAGCMRPSSQTPTPTVLVGVYVPSTHVEAVRLAMSGAGAGETGNYRGCAFEVDGRGQFTPLPGATPTIGALGVMTTVSESKIEMVAPRDAVDKVIEAVYASHPYEEPVFHILPMDSRRGAWGYGAWGELPSPLPLETLLGQWEPILGPAGIRIAGGGDRERLVSRVGVCGGSGKFLLAETARLHLDVYITADVTYHSFFTSQLEGQGGVTTLIDIGHYESETGFRDLLRSFLVPFMGQDLVTASQIHTSPIRGWHRNLE